jgi:hypothetical protein
MALLTELENVKINCLNFLEFFKIPIQFALDWTTFCSRTRGFQATRLRNLRTACNSPHKPNY